MKYKRLFLCLLVLIVSISTVGCMSIQQSSIPTGNTIFNKEPTISPTESQTTPSTSSNTEETNNSSTEETATPTANNELRPEFKAAMDSYEEFMDEYVAFMKKFAESDGTDLSIITEYSRFMSEYAEFVATFEEWNSEEMNAAEAAYYLEVSNRVNQKLLEIAY